MKPKIFFILTSALLLTGCSLKGLNSTDHGEQSTTFSQDSGIGSQTGGSEISIEISDSSDVEIEDTTDITDLSVSGIAYDNVNKLFTITSSGEFVFTGEFNGNILVNAGDEDEVKITLNNFSIKSTSESPIKCDNASELQISIKSGTKNYIYDYREPLSDEESELGKGAITSACDMKVTGKGSLCIAARYYNGIHCKDDLKIKPEVNDGSSIQIEAYNNCLKGNDSVEIQSGNLVLISTSGNGIITENTDISSKGNQRGNVVISGGHVDIYSAKDAIDAAYNVEICKGESEAPIINIYTSKYSSYTSGTITSSSSTFYLCLSGQNNSSYYYGVEFLSNDYNTSWVKATYIKNDYRNTYYEVEKPSNATSFKVCLFANSVAVANMSEDNAYAKMSSFQSINSSYDMVKINQRNTTIEVNGWSNYGQSQQDPHGGPGGPGEMGSEGNESKSDVSAKGIKAENEINISDGTFFIKSYDDAIHTNYNTSFENGSIGIGDVNISGGTFDIYASDDGIHADHTLNISGGTINVEYSYEGIEANIINFLGGYTKVYSIDDGLNAANKSGVTPSINVSDGIVDITVYGQDVDGIDSNGSYTQSGGKVISKGANSQMSTGLDCDGSATIKGGTFVSFGRTEKTPTTSSGVSSYTLSGNYSAGSYKIDFPDSTSVDVITKYSYNSIIVYSDNSTHINISKN